MVVSLGFVLETTFSKKPIENKFKALAEKYCSTENCNLLTVPRVNPGIWNYLPWASRRLDARLQEAQKSAVHTGQAITPEIIARLPVRFFVFHWQCFFSGLSETQRAHEARFIKEFSISLFLCLAFFLEMSSVKV